jgi:hypothetical protein
MEVQQSLTLQRHIVTSDLNENCTLSCWSMLTMCKPKHQDGHPVNQIRSALYHSTNSIEMFFCHRLASVRTLSLVGQNLTQNSTLVLVRSGQLSALLTSSGALCLEFCPSLRPQPQNIQPRPSKHYSYTFGLKTVLQYASALAADHL